MLRMHGTVQNYAWGSMTEIPRILGTEPTGKPMAEYWLGAHASAPAEVEGRHLDELVAEQPGIVGGPSIERFGARLPYLLKVLAADQALSLQAHPSREQAEEGFARENAAGLALTDPTRTYKDDWPKPEMMVALTPFDALCGFRDPDETVRLFKQLDVAGANHMMAPLTLRGGAAGLAEVFLDALSVSDERRDLVNEVVAKAVNHTEDEGDFGLFCRTAVLLDASYPGDPSILAALMMNRTTLQPGEAIFLPAGNMHAYLQGSGIEVMANSDNVLRGGLTVKHIDVDELVRVVDFDAEPVSLVVRREDAPGLIRYVTPAPEFALWRIDLTQANLVQLPATALGRILLVIEGELETAEGVRLGKGESVFVPAGEESSLTGDAVAFLAAAGV